MNNKREILYKFRDFNNSQLPKWYGWKRHLLLNVLIFVTTLLIASSKIHFFNLKSISLILFFTLFWGFIEYFLHRFGLHGKNIQEARLKKEHSIFHHGYFTEDFMSAERGIDTNRVLLMPLDLLTLIAVNATISALVYSFVDQNLGVLFFSAGIFYSMLYEVIHALCHSRLQTKNVFLKRILNNHKVHHSAAKMTSKNFAVVFPFIDSLFGTREMPDE